MSEFLKQELLSRIKESTDFNEWQKVEYWAQQWIQAYPKEDAGFLHLARASVKLGKLERASYAYRRLLDFNPQNQEALKHFEDYPATSSVVQKAPTAAAASKGPDKNSLKHLERKELAEAEAKVGQSYLKFHLFEEAARCFEKSFFWFETESAALDYARALHRCGRGREAQRFLRDQIIRFPKWVDGQLLLGRVCFESGQKQSAQRAWQDALKLDPENENALKFLRGIYESL
jgi:tetratricopeptide (TPR) repeat protein